jgi:hypothetical protein
MLQHCEQCGRRYDDKNCTTKCPHKGKLYCAVCDCLVCVCEEKSSRDWERSSKNRELPPDPNRNVPKIVQIIATQQGTTVLRDDGSVFYGRNYYPRFTEDNPNPEPVWKWRRIPTIEEF